MPGKYIEPKRARSMSRQKSFTSPRDAFLALAQATMWNLEVLRASRASLYRAYYFWSRETLFTKICVSHLTGRKAALPFCLHGFTSRFSVYLQSGMHDACCPSNRETGIFFYICGQPEIIIKQFIFLPQGVIDLFRYKRRSAFFLEGESRPIIN